MVNADHYFDLVNPRDLARLEHPQAGAEVDLFWQQNGKNYAVEFKYCDAPRRSKSMMSALEDL
jgi:hypothetical protein